MSPQSFKKIGTYFQSQRKRCGFTQEEIGDFLGYSSKQIVSNWERGLCSPPICKVKSLIALFNLDATEVLDLFVESSRNELIEMFGMKKRKK